MTAAPGGAVRYFGGCEQLLVYCAGVANFISSTLYTRYICRTQEDIMHKNDLSVCIAKGFMTVGAVNWGLVGAARVDLVEKLLGKNTIASRTVYSLVGLSGAYYIVRLLTDRASD
jgi:hypothetical protein